jgi:hypothetical protein
MPRFHDRDHFFKYVTKDVAKLIINDQKLKWSCPLDFNDPFDHQFAFIDEDRIEVFTGLLIHRIQEYVWNRNDIQFNVTDDPFGFGQILTRLKQMKSLIPREEFLRNTETILPQMIDSGRRATVNFNEETRLFVLQTRVMCLTEENDNLLMWGHYTASHTGAVFKLKAIDDLDVPFLVARKVRYSREYPVLVTEEEWINHLLYVNRIMNIGERHIDLFCTKGIDWSYEKEWRISITNEDYPLREAIYLREPPEVFGAIYLGCRMPQEDKEQIMELANQSLPNMEIWQARQGKRTYNIEFEQVR